MATKKHHTPEQIIHLLRQAEVELAGGQPVAWVSRKLGVSETTFYHWKKYAGMGDRRAAPGQAARGGESAPEAGRRRSHAG